MQKNIAQIKIHKRRPISDSIFFIHNLTIKISHKYQFCLFGQLAFVAESAFFYQVNALHGAQIHAKHFL